MNYIDFLPAATAAIDIAHDMLLTRGPGDLTSKGDRDMASEADYAIERRLAAFLRGKTPRVGFLGEEDGEQGIASDLTWTLDPIDGTVNYIHGSPLCGTSLALIHGRTPVLGVVDLPFLGLRYTAIQDSGAFCGQRQIRVTDRAALKDAVVAIGDYAVGTGAAERNAVRLEVTRHLAATAQRVRMHGSAATDLVWLAEGRVDGVIIMSNQPWDTAAGVIIAREAGAEIVDQDGTPHNTGSSATLAANPLLLPTLLELVAKSRSDSAPEIP